MANPIPLHHLHALGITDASASLASSADLAETLGLDDLASIYRGWSKSARDMGMLGNQLYRHWAGEAAAYTANKLAERAAA